MKTFQLGQNRLKGILLILLFCPWKSIKVSWEAVRKFNQDGHVQKSRQNEVHIYKGKLAVSSLVIWSNSVTTILIYHLFSYLLNGHRDNWMTLLNDYWMTQGRKGLSWHKQGHLMYPSSPSFPKETFVFCFFSPFFSPFHHMPGRGGVWHFHNASTQQLAGWHKGMLVGSSCSGEGCSGMHELGNKAELECFQSSGDEILENFCLKQRMFPSC